MNDVDVRQLGEADLEALRAMREVGFQVRSDFDDPEVRGRLVERMEHMIGVFVDGTLVTAGAFCPFSMFVRGAPARVAGLASVTTAPEHRRRGYVRRLLRVGLEEIADRNVGWCLEYPFEPAFYARYGWQTLSTGVFVEAPAECFRSPDARAGGQRMALDSGEALARSRSIYQAWASHYNFAMARDGRVRDDWERVLRGPVAEREEGQKRFLYLFDEAYCVLELSGSGTGEVLEVVDWAYAAPEGRRALFGLWGNFAGQVDRIRLQLPDDDPRSFELASYHVAYPDPVQGRIVDVCAALSGIATDDAPDFVLEVEDDFCPWNAGRFRVTCDDGRTHANRTQLPPNLRLDIRDLAVLLSGSLPAGAAVRTGVADGAPEVARQLRRLAGPRCHVPLADYF